MAIFKDFVHFRTYRHSFCHKDSVFATNPFLCKVTGQIKMLADFFLKNLNRKKIPDNSIMGGSKYFLKIYVTDPSPS